MRRRGTLVGLVLLGALVGCDPSTVTIRFHPSVGDTTTYRYEITATVTRRLAGGAPVSTSESTRLEATQTVLSVEGGEARLEVALSRDGAGERTVEVRTGRADQLAGIDAVEGVPVAALGLVGLADLFQVGSAAPPAGPLEPGQRWTVNEDVTVAGSPARVSGEGRLDRLGVVAGNDVATVVTTLMLPLRLITDTGDGLADLSGRQTTRSSATYDLADGSVRSSVATSTGRVRISIAPPGGLIGPPATGSLSYEIRVVATRVE
jgi:hypothetical protein